MTSWCAAPVHSLHPPSTMVCEEVMQISPWGPVTDLLLCMAFPPSLGLPLGSAHPTSMPDVHPSCQCYSSSSSFLSSHPWPCRHSLHHRSSRVWPSTEHCDWACAAPSQRISSFSDSSFFLPALTEVISSLSCPMEEAKRQGSGERNHKKNPHESRFDRKSG